MRNIFRRNRRKDSTDARTLIEHLDTHHHFFFTDESVPGWPSDTAIAICLRKEDGDMEKIVDGNGVAIPDAVESMMIERNAHCVMIWSVHAISGESVQVEGWDISAKEAVHLIRTTCAAVAVGASIPPFHMLLDLVEDKVLIFTRGS